MIDITNEILTNLKTKLKTVSIRSPYDDIKPTFPTVTFGEIGNTTYNNTITTNGEEHSVLSFDINIFTNGSKKESECKKIRNKIDDIMIHEYKMTRIDSRQVENYLDPTIFRWVLRYSCIVSNDNVIYRR